MNINQELKQLNDELNIWYKIQNLEQEIEIRENMQELKIKLNNKPSRQDKNAIYSLLISNNLALNILKQEYNQIGVNKNE